MRDLPLPRTNEKIPGAQKEIEWSGARRCATNHSLRCDPQCLGPTGSPRPAVDTGAMKASPACCLTWHKNITELAPMIYPDALRRLYADSMQTLCRLYADSIAADGSKSKIRHGFSQVPFSVILRLGEGSPLVSTPRCFGPFGLSMTLQGTFAKP